MVGEAKSIVARTIHRVCVWESTKHGRKRRKYLLQGFSLFPTSFITASSPLVRVEKYNYNSMVVICDDSVYFFSFSFIYRRSVLTLTLPNWNIDEHNTWFQLVEWHWMTDRAEESVEQDQTAHMCRLILIYTLCKFSPWWRIAMVEIQTQFKIRQYFQLIICHRNTLHDWHI